MQVLFLEGKPAASLQSLLKGRGRGTGGGGDGPTSTLAMQLLSLSPSLSLSLSPRPSLSLPVPCVRILLLKDAWLSHVVWKSILKHDVFLVIL